MKNVLIFINDFFSSILKPCFNRMCCVCYLYIDPRLDSPSGGIQYGKTPWISLSKGLDLKLIMAIDLDKKGADWKPELLASDLERKQTAWHAYTRQLTNGWFHQLSIPDIKGINQRAKLTLYSLAGPKLGLNCTYIITPVYLTVKGISALRILLLLIPEISHLLIFYQRK